MAPRCALAILALVTIAAPASARVSPSVGQAGPRQVPTAAGDRPTASTTERPQLKPPKYRLPIQFVRTADDDGGGGSTLTRAQAQAAIDAANVIYRRNGGDVSFVMHADSNFDDVVRSTALNRDCIFAPGQSIATIEANTDHGVDPNTLCDKTTPSDARTAYGLERADRIVVFSRGGNYKLVWDSGGGHWHVDRPSGGESWGTKAFVRMPKSFDGSSLLAHELGHYLHNPHTFDGNPSVATAAEAKAAMEAWVAEHPGDHPSAAFDGDARNGSYPVDDTPPDPRGSVFIDVHGGDKCDPDHPSVTIGVVIDGVRQNVTLTPDRSNVMSYFKGCPFPQHFSKAQYRNIHAALAGNRRDLLGSGGGCYSRGRGGAVVTGESGLLATIRRVAACKLLERKPMPWEEVMGEIYSRPGDLKAGFRRVDVKDGAIGVHVAREKALLAALRISPPEE